MWAIALKEFRQLRRDRQNGRHAVPAPASSSSSSSATPPASTSRKCPRSSSGLERSWSPRSLPEELRVVATRPGDGAAQARDALRRGEAVAAVVTPSRTGTAPLLYLDGTELFATQAALRALAQAGGAARREAAAAVATPGRAQRDPLQPRSAHRRHHDPRPVRHHPRLRRDRGHGPRRGARTAGRHHGATRRHAVPPARRLHRQDRAVHGHRRPRHGHRRRRRHAALRRAVPRLGRGVRPRRRAVPVRDPGHRRPHLHGVADPGPGHPARDDDPAPAVPAQRPVLPPLLDALGRALDRLHPAADLLHQGGARSHGARRAARRAVDAAARARRHGDRRCSRPRRCAFAAIWRRPGERTTTTRRDGHGATPSATTAAETGP